MSNLLLMLVKALVATMFSALTGQQVRSIINKAFDAVEEKVKATDTHWDDVVVLPMLKGLRAALALEKK